MKISQACLLILLLGAAPLLAACSSSCDCPKCPATTVVTPEHRSTVITPEE